MKAKAFFFLLIFAAFLVVPVVINMLSDNGNKIVVAITEEENTKNFKTELKKDFRVDRNMLPLYSSEIKLSKNNNSAYIISSYSIYLDPVSPPPRQA